MSIRRIDQLKQGMGKTGQGVGIGALAGSIAGLLLGLTSPFNHRLRPRRAALVSGIGAVTGGAIGALIWRRPGESALEKPAIGLASLPGRWTLFQEQVIEIPETAEVQVATKQLRQVEEVRVSPVETAHVTTIEDNVRHTEVDIQQAHGASARELRTGEAGERNTRGPEAL